MEDKKNEFYVVSVEDTIKHGIVSAAIIGRIRHWCEYNKKRKTKNCYHDECWWSGFMSSKEFSVQLGVPSKTIENHLSKLLKDGIIIKGVFNKKGFDRTGWYRVNPNPQIEENHFPKLSKSISPNQGNAFPPIEETIPVSTSVSKTISTSVSNSVSKNVELTNFEKEQLLLVLDTITAPDRVLSLVRTLVTDGAGYLTSKNRELVLQHKHYFNKGKILQQVIQQLE